MKKLFLIVLLLAGCGDEVAVKEVVEPPRRAKIEITPGTSELVFNIPRKDIECTATLPVDEIGEEFYPLEIKCSTAKSAMNILWMAVMKSTGRMRMDFVLPEIEGERKVYEKLDLRLVKGVRHEIDLRAWGPHLASDTRPQAERCPKKYQECPLMQNIVVDLSEFK